MEANAKAGELVAFMHTLVGIREEPPGSNEGAAVRTIQSATGAYGAPWCVSTGQYGWKHVLGTTYANDTANAYYLENYARVHGHVIAAPVPGCGVVYQLGAGHYGTVATVYPDGTFLAIEGNEQDAVRIVHRDPRTIRCTFVLRPELRAPAKPKPKRKPAAKAKPMPTATTRQTARSTERRRTP